MKKGAKKPLFLVIALALVYGIAQERGITLPGLAGQDQVSGEVSGNALQQAISNRKSDVQVRGEGVVVKVLPDDLDGSRHQRLLVKLPAGQTILIAHNIDLAPRVANLRAGDTLAFYGEYEWNEKGGVVHWTHHDPGGRHIGGWLEHQGKTYQ
ncbi:uncharacterized protein DUF3465 [Thiogranum longum]|uniref:Uncharacterized protein DUF3465 n=1 Tax=Thiogranum longum TaxID=1537524 RepID=A0A4R1HAZ5_9GAMM|nr:DUF3465 domain-containing protein [Thiogranum longum]TCK17673.1 uncharacterized protein DUF3465 [Thiogranum longum]